MKGLGCSDNFAGLYREMLAAIGTGLVRFEGNGRSIRGATTLREVLGALAV
jgi:hypothetical protein